MKRSLIIAAAAVIVLTAAGCSKTSDNAVVAKVNNSKITAADFKRQLEGLENFQMEQSVATDTKARQEFLDDLIGIELVLQEAKRQGLDKDPEYKKSLDSYKKEYEDTKKRLERRYQDASRNELFRMLLKKELQEKAAKLAAPSDQEARDFYAKNKDKMVGMNGKALAYKDVEPQIKSRLTQEKQRDLYLDYIKDLRAKSKVTVDDKTLDAVASSMTMSATLQLDLPQGKTEKKDEQKEAKPAEKKAEKKN